MMAAADQDPLLLLDELLACLDAGRVPPDDVRQWFADGIRSAVDGHTLDAGLGLVRRGQHPVRGRLLRRLVDQYLRLTIEAVPMAGPGPSRWERCLCAATLVSRYLASTWRYDRHLTEPPSGRPAWQTWLWHAAQLKPDLPCTPHGMWEAFGRDLARSLKPLPSNLMAHFMSHPCPHPINASRSSALSVRAE
jgi:hypothetical protein